MTPDRVRALSTDLQWLLESIYRVFLTDREMADLLELAIKRYIPLGPPEAVASEPKKPQLIPVAEKIAGRLPVTSGV